LNLSVAWFFLYPKKSGDESMRQAQKISVMALNTVQWHNTTATFKITKVEEDDIVTSLGKKYIKYFLTVIGSINGQVVEGQMGCMRSELEPLAKISLDPADWTDREILCKCQSRKYKQKDGSDGEYWNWVIVKVLPIVEVVG
jgi:hypothetical protein